MEKPGIFTIHLYPAKYSKDENFNQFFQSESVFDSLDRAQLCQTHSHSLTLSGDKSIRATWTGGVVSPRVINLIEIAIEFG